jgi:hypothetical protein
MNTPTSLPPLYPGYPQLNRTEGPVKVFGMIYAIFALLSGIGFLFLVALAVIPGFGNHGASNADQIDTFVPKILFGSLAVVTGVIAALQAVTAYGLLALKSFGRTLAIVTGAISCIGIPVGTLLGAFTLYFLLRQGTQQEYALLVAKRPH